MHDPGDPDPYRAPTAASPAAAVGEVVPDLLPGLAAGLARVRLVLPLLVPLVAIQAALEPIASGLLPPDLEQGAVLVGAFATVAAQLGVVHALHEAVSGRPATVVEAFGFGWLRTVEGWFALVTYSAASLLGLLLLVGPGLWVMTRAAFLLHVIALERRGFGRAWELTAGLDLRPLALLQWSSWGLVLVVVQVLHAALGLALGPEEPFYRWAAGVAAILPGTACAVALYDPYRRLTAS